MEVFGPGVKKRVVFVEKKFGQAVMNGFIKKELEKI